MVVTEGPTVRERLFPEGSKEYVSLTYAVVLLWGLGDIFSTYFAYAIVGGTAGEANPWMHILLTYNPVLVAVVKGAVVLYVGIILIEYEGLVRKAPGWRVWLTTLVIAGILVVLNNLTVGVLAAV
jgi:hypothetical protein